jgi:NAD-dependent SIR2 family protein deacetylase
LGAAKFAEGLALCYTPFCTPPSGGPRALIGLVCPKLAAAIEHAAELLRTAGPAVALTGAGVSTGSGIPDFRSGQAGPCARAGPPKVASIDACVETGTLPTCAACGGLRKPDVTLMGAELPGGVLAAARQAVRTCEVVLVASCSLEVMPVARLPLEALHQGAQLMLVKDLPAHLDQNATVLIEGDVSEVLPRIVEAVEDCHAG